MSVFITPADIFCAFALGFSVLVFGTLWIAAKLGERKGRRDAANIYEHKVKR